RVGTRAIGALIAEVTGTGKVERLSRLPDRVSLTEIIANFAGSPAAEDPLNIPFAIGGSALQPVALPTRVLPNVLVVGRQLCGKTTTLAAFGRAITERFTPEQAQITII